MNLSFYLQHVTNIENSLPSMFLHECSKDLQGTSLFSSRDTTFLVRNSICSWSVASIPGAELFSSTSASATAMSTLPLSQFYLFKRYHLLTRSTTLPNSLSTSSTKSLCNSGSPRIHLTSTWQVFAYDQTIDKRRMQRLK